MSLDTSPRRSEHIGGLDTLRFICAGSVVLSHLGGPPVGALLSRIPHFGREIQGAFNNCFPGAPAVIVFFLISGFCIHYPFASSEKSFNALSFLTRRLLRIGIPIVVALALLPSIGLGFKELNGAILWSLICEILYYLAYPLLRRLAKIIKWERLTIVSLMVALGIVANHPGAKNYHEMGPMLTAMLGLPCWLLGVVLADSPITGIGTHATVWGRRVLVYTFAFLSSVARFHSPMGFPSSLTIFSVICFFWLREEIAWRRFYPAPKLLELGGTWSYSLYLFHLPAAALVSRILHGIGVESETASWGLKMTGVCGLAYICYLYVEKPSQKLSRLVAQKICPSSG